MESNTSIVVLTACGGHSAGRNYPPGSPLGLGRLGKVQGVKGLVGLGFGGIRVEAGCTNAIEARTGGVLAEPS